MILPVCQLPKITIHLEVYEKGNLIHQHTEPGHSWVRNAYSYMWNLISKTYIGTVTFGDGYTALKATTGDSYTAVTSWWNAAFHCPDFGPMGYGIIGSAGQDTRGIVVGSSNTAFSFNDYKLGSKWLNGSLANKIEYSDQTIISSSYAAGTFTWAHTTYRYFNNNSGGTLDIKETGVNHLGSSLPCLIIRDVLTSPLAILDDQQLKVTYVFTQTFPA
jgi:hypothetical protein